MICAGHSKVFKLTTRNSPARVFNTRTQSWADRLSGYSSGSRPDDERVAQTEMAESSPTEMAESSPDRRTGITHQPTIAPVKHAAQDCGACTTFGAFRDGYAISNWVP